MLLINGYAESLNGAEYQYLDLVRRLEALVEHRFGNDLVSVHILSKGVMRRKDMYSCWISRSKIQYILSQMAQN
ncbi:MAG: hypothetical protein ACKPKO_49105, partial [Candidatus Fonsibacter sp.]